jgi:hypothetical protein
MYVLRNIQTRSRNQQFSPKRLIVVTLQNVAVLAAMSCRVLLSVTRIL